MTEPIFKSIPDMLRQNASRFHDRVALKYRKMGSDAFVTLTYAAYYQRALMAARGLIKMGVKRGERVAILSENRAGWVIADMGILCAGGVTVPIYPTNTPEHIQYMVNHSGARIAFISGKFQYSKLLSVRAAMPGLELIVSFERFLGDPKLPVITFYHLSEIDTPIAPEEKKEIEAIIDTVSPNDLLTLIYTSGTTGIPKGVMLTHNNVLTNMQYLTEQSDALSAENDVLLSFLPLSHILERTAGYYMTIRNGALMAFADSIEKVPENMLEIRPTIMVSVPRLFEKIYHRIYDTAHEMPTIKKSIFHWAIEVGKQYVQEKYIQKRAKTSVDMKYSLADRLVFSKIRERFGGRMKLFCCGGAPLDKTINQFFWIIGIPIFEGYGLTETSPAVAFNNFAHVRFGSVGFPLKETDIRIAEDGEILVKGPQVMPGYFNNPEATADVLQDGWFATGDIGKIEDGFLTITDRKKELIITAGGKNIAPQPIENEFKMDKYISSVFVYGDRKPYLTALIVPTVERLFEFAKENHIHYYELEDLVQHDLVQKHFEQRIADINRHLPQYETIKKFQLLAHDFSIDGGELTPTLKLRRKFIYEKYEHKIEDMYTEHRN